MVLNFFEKISFSSVFSFGDLRKIREVSKHLRETANVKSEVHDGDDFNITPNSCLVLIPIW